ncbi:MAG: rod shape-determining protein MreC [Betaproteobacteria bacterium]|nr:rod shape-determining protein MreC [Betaproteobacteria bacterium]
MRPIPVDTPAFFNRGPSPLARLAFFGLLSLVLLFTDTRYRYLEYVREVVAIGLYPLQRVLLVPGVALDYVQDYFGSKRQLADENATLKRALLASGPATQGYGLARQENARLKALLGLREQYDGAATPVQVLYAGRDPFSQKLFVNKGSTGGIEAGEGVIDETGVVGQVTRVFPYMSEVTLITDRDQAVPVKVERSGVRSVMFGNGTGHAPELRFTAPSADLRVGDRLVTSGIDGTYPPGLAVARIVDIVRDTGQMFARIACKPTAGVDRSEYLLVLARPATMPPRPEEPTHPDAVKKSGRPRDATRPKAHRG